MKLSDHFINPRRRGFWEKLKGFLVYAYPWLEPIPTDEYSELLRQLGENSVLLPSGKIGELVPGRDKEIMDQIDKLPKW